MVDKTGDITRATLAAKVLNGVSVQQNAAESTYCVYQASVLTSIDIYLVLGIMMDGSSIMERRFCQKD